MAQTQTGTAGGKGTQGQTGAQGTSGMQGTSGTQGTSGVQGQTGMRTGAGSDTGIDNVAYDLVSVAYHALQGAQTYQLYAQDAQRGNTQFAEFFRKVCDDNKRCAQEALDLLQQCLGRQGMQQGGQSAQGQGAADDSGQYGRGTR